MSDLIPLNTKLARRGDQLFVATDTDDLYGYYAGMTEREVIVMVPAGHGAVYCGFPIEMLVVEGGDV